jgi:hypothetical protein
MLGERTRELLDRARGPLCEAVAVNFGTEHGPWLIPLRFFELGGEVAFDNLVVKDAAEAMRIRGPIAVQIHDLPPGTEIRLIT